MSDNNTSLPAEVVEQINKEAENYATIQWGDPAKFPPVDTMHINRENSIDDYKAGATEYATKLHEANAALKDYSDIIDRMEKEGAEMKRLLREVFMKHESGLLPDRFVYDKIKKFLYGE
jgi:hypothetical protein